MLNILHFPHGIEYQVEVGKITLIMMRTEEHWTYFNLVEDDYVNRVHKVCVAYRDNLQTATFYLLSQSKPVGLYL